MTTRTASPTTTLDHALRLVGAGISGLPLAIDGTKAPAWQVLPYDEAEQKRVWKPYQSRLPSQEELKEWLGNGRRLAFGMICGAVSGNLETIDFDELAKWEQYQPLVEEEAPGLRGRLVIIQTPRPGVQVQYRCEEPVEGNQKLARGERPDEHGELKPKTLIETRGEGGYVVAPGSPVEVHETGRPYEVLQGDPAAPPLITAAERAILLNCARALNEYLEPEREVRSERSQPTAGGDLLPGADYNGRGDYISVLQKHGWTKAKRVGTVTYWRRPGKKKGYSATLGAVATDVFYIFSSNADPFEADHGYDPFEIFTRLEHKGDHSAAAKALYADGFGDRVKTADDEEPPHPAASVPTNGDRRTVGSALSLAEVTATFQKWLYLPNDGYIKIGLAAYAANHMKGDPVWLMIVGAPGSGKTELINALARLPHVHMRSSLSGESALLSGTSKKDRSASAKGGLLREMGAFGVLGLKDFTSILALKHEQRGPLLAALREIYDGSWSRSIGTDGGQTLSWAGKLGIIAGCTWAIDSHHSVISAMGERFVFTRLPPIEGEKQAERALDNDEKQEEMRQELAEVVARLFVDRDLSRIAGPLPTEEKSRLVDLASLAACCRSAVERDGKNYEITLIPPSEAPARLAGSLIRLRHGMAAIGVDPDETWQLLASVAIHSMPALRWAAFRYIAEKPFGAPATAPEVGIATCHPTNTVRRALEDLNAHRVLRRGKGGPGGADLWELSRWARDKYERVAEYTRKLPQHILPDDDLEAPPPPPLDSTIHTIRDFSGRPPADAPTSNEGAEVEL